MGGAHSLFADLDDRVSWQRGALQVTLRADGLNRSVAVGGRGLVLAPSLFIRGALTMIDPGEPPHLAYQARARATLWERPSRLPTSAALEELPGRTRAGILTMLEHPASTTELARLLGVTPSAVSRHLTALHSARLLNRARSGRAVLYFRSELGDALLA